MRLREGILEELKIIKNISKKYFILSNKLIDELIHYYKIGTNNNKKIHIKIILIIYNDLENKKSYKNIAYENGFSEETLKRYIKEYNIVLKNILIEGENNFKTFKKAIKQKGITKDYTTKK